MYEIKTSLYCLTIGAEDSLIKYSISNATKELKGPLFEVNGELLYPSFSSVTLSNKATLNEHLTEYTIDAVYDNAPSITLKIKLRIAEHSPIFKLRYLLVGNGSSCLTKKNGERLDYCTLAIDPLTARATEVRFSEFNEMLHTFCMNEAPALDSAFDRGFALMGPLMAIAENGFSYLLAYEHGSQYPDDFVNFRLTPDRKIILSAKKGNYLDQATLDEKGFETIWIDFGVVKGGIDVLAATFREFILKYSTLNLESRKPYIFYNTWNYQERNRFWNKKAYLADMTKERMLKEIDAAHEMGIEVFVIDTGWYEKTGDWIVNSSKFDDGMKEVKARLDGYGMKLGLWIGPSLAAVTSLAHAKHPDCKVDNNGSITPPYPVWETEESYTMCLVSDYWEELADTLIGLAKKLGVTYFKWDSVGQYGCTSAHHHHGNEKNTVEERADAYAFRVGIYLEKIVNKVCRACPEVIIDFDVTEGHRSVGLGFLSVGKYFLINNGPYYRNYSIPCDPKTNWTNIFVYPGAPRTWVCRSPLTFDKWIPSVLFLTHYLPDEPIDSQDINIASLILGQNGIWGDLPALSSEGRMHFNEILSYYKRVRDDITSEGAIKTGMTGSGFECYEKINSKTGKGVVCVFSTVNNTFRYITEKKADASVWCSREATVKHLEDGRAEIIIDFEGEGAVMIFFGA